MPGFDDIDRQYRPAKPIPDTVTPELRQETRAQFYDRRGWPDSASVASHHLEHRRAEEWRLRQMADALAPLIDSDARTACRAAYYSVMKAESDVIAQRHGFYGEMWRDKSVSTK